ncbi:MAG: thioredoxin domain-containing protein [Proteobacteria bacterium]|nr:thioredoxin domain-containing protein [Pseudomonadota bacterium]
MRILVAIVVALFATAAPVAGQQAWYPLRGDDGSALANHRVPTELTSEIERLPGVVVAGNPKGDVTLVEFYDLNCPYCRKAAADVAALIDEDKELRLVLVAFPVLGVPSIEASRVELAIAKIGTPQQFVQFHHKVYAGRGVVDGRRALAVAAELGFSADKLLPIANDDAITETMKAHVRLGSALELNATPAFVIKGVGILGHPGRKSLRGIIAAVRRCDNVVC